jgi:hypothetical protein
VYGPVRTVVWQGSVGDRRPYADQSGLSPYTINDEHDDVPEVSYLVKVDGLSLFHAGDYIRPLDTYQSDVDYVLSKAGRIELAFLSRVFHA